MSKKSVRFIDFKALKAVVKMPQVLAHYGLTEQFKRGNDSLSGPCPIHKGTHPTQFRVSISKNCWNCFSDCHCGGNVLDFVAKMENVDANVAANRMIEWFNLDVEKLNAEYKKTERKTSPEAAGDKPPSASMRKVTQKPKPQTSKHNDEQDLAENKPLSFALKLEVAHPYFAERGLEPKTVAEFGLGFCAKGVMSGRIAIPIHNLESKLVGYAGRWPGEPPEERPKYRLPDGFKKASEVYRLSQALREPGEFPLIIVEGFFDVMKLWQLGIRKTVALMGSSMSTAQEQLIARVTNANSTIIVMFDEDDAGRTGREAVVQRLATIAFVRVVALWNEGCQPEDLTAEEADHLGLTQP